MDNKFQIKFDYSGSIDIRSILECIDSVQHAISKTNEWIVEEALASGKLRSDVSFDDLMAAMPETIFKVETAVLGTWSLKGQLSAGLFTAFMAIAGVGFSQTSGYEAAKEEFIELYDGASETFCKHLNDGGVFGVSLDKIKDGYCVTFKRNLSERIFKDEPIFSFKGEISHHSPTKDTVIVRSIQEVLNELGYQTEKNGKFELPLSLTIQEFQRNWGIADDGIVGEQTIEKLKLAVLEKIG
jgi:hypothetical protein